MNMSFRESLNLQHNRSAASIALRFRDYLIKIKTLKPRISSIWVLYKANAQENGMLHLRSTLSTDTCPHEFFWNIKADVPAVAQPATSTRIEGRCFSQHLSMQK